MPLSRGEDTHGMHTLPHGTPFVRIRPALARQLPPAPLPVHLRSQLPRPFGTHAPDDQIPSIDSRTMRSPCMQLFYCRASADTTHVAY